MDHGLHSNISLNSHFCPNCHTSSYSEHFMAEHRDYNKCSGCGYMELKTITLNRILNELAPDQLTEPFVDPLTKIKQKTIDMCIHCKNIKKQDCSDSHCNCPCNN